MNSVELIDENIIDLQLQEEALKLAKRKVKWNANRSLLSGIVNALVKLGLEPHITEYITVNCTGDAKKLAAVVRIFRISGFSSNADKPKKGDSTWYAFFDSPECPIRIWFAFTSSVCRRVQIGTKIAEIPIYETICGEEIAPCETALISVTESTPALMEQTSHLS